MWPWQGHRDSSSCTQCYRVCDAETAAAHDVAALKIQKLQLHTLWPYQVNRSSSFTHCGSIEASEVADVHTGTVSKKQWYSCTHGGRNEKTEVAAAHTCGRVWDTNTTAAHNVSRSMTHRLQLHTMYLYQGYRDCSCTQCRRILDIETAHNVAVSNIPRMQPSPCHRNQDIPTTAAPQWCRPYPGYTNYTRASLIRGREVMLVGRWKPCDG